MSRRQTNAGLVLKLPSAIADAIRDAMSPSQRKALTARQAAQLLQVATDAAARVAEILEPDPAEPEFDFDGER